MSIIIQIGPSHLSTTSGVAPHPACIVEAETTLDMGPDLEYDAETPVTSEENSAVSVSTIVTSTHSRKEVRSTSNLTHGFASCFGLPYQDHNYGAPPPPSPPQSPLPKVNGITDDETSFSVISTSTNNEDDTQEESITRCICGFDHDDEYMICCDRCSVWQHVDCMGLNQNNIPETYLCEKCEPRKVDRQKAKALQTRKKEAMTDSTTDDSGEDENSGCHSSIHSGAIHPERTTKLRKRRKERKGGNKSDSGIIMKTYKTLKGNKDRVERTRTGIRRKAKSESTSTGDEEAQDAWESSMYDWNLKYEEASVNQYTPEVQLLAGSFIGQIVNDTVKKLSEQLRVRLCNVVDFSSKKRLIAAVDISQDQAVIEYKGKFLSATQFFEQNPVFNKRSYPFVLFLKMDKHSDICIDAREYGNEARFVRRTSNPNTEVRPMINNGLLHVYLFSLKEIKKDEEITISYDFSYPEYTSEKRKKGKRYSDVDNDNNQSSILISNTNISTSPCKLQKSSPVKSITCQSTPVLHPVSSPADTTLDCSKISQEEHDADEQSCRKMTREQRKIDAIMRAFERMEKTAKRRQQALERMAQQKAQKQEAEKDHNDVLDIKSESNIDDDCSNLQSSGDVICSEELKPSLITSCPNSTIHSCRHKKGKRRRGSGTPARRRTRSNSGGSDIMSPDELPSLGVNQISLNSLVSPTNITNVSTSCCTTVTTSATSNNNSFPKTKKFLMQEWLQEKAEISVPVSCPLTIHTELSWNLSTASPTCYVRCTRDSPNAGGISSAHLRRNSTSCMGQTGKSLSNLGSAKKRWLRQAMFESGTSEIECSNFETAVLDGGQNSPLHNGCFSPNPHSDASSPCVSPPGDIVTPLKKRRLMRESLESLPSPRSPSPIATCGWAASISSVESPDHSNSALEETFPTLDSEEKIIQIENSMDDEVDDASIVQSGLNGLSIHLVSTAKELREQWITKDESSDMEPSSSSGLNQDITANEENNISHNSDVAFTNATVTDSSQDSSCLDLTYHDERESHVSSSENTVPVNSVQSDNNDLQIVSNVSSSTLCDNNEVSSTNKEFGPVEDNKDSLPDSSLNGDVELSNRIKESEVCSVQQENIIAESNSVQDCVTSSHFVNSNVINDKQESSNVHASALTSSVESAQSVTLPVTTSSIGHIPSFSTSSTINMSTCTNMVSSSINQKRKVSLSEYRMRMREQANTSSSDSKSQKTDNLPSVKNEEHANLQDSASPLCPPRVSVHSKCEQSTDIVKQKDILNKEEYQSGDLDVRWNAEITDAVSEHSTQSETINHEQTESSKEESIKSQDQSTLSIRSVPSPVSILQLCVQPPPPPPLPSVSTSPVKSNTVSQFRYPTAQPYCQQPFIVAQVASPYVALPPLPSQTISPTSIPVIHHSSHIPPPPPPIIPVPPPTINPSSSLQHSFPAPSTHPPPPPPPPPNGYNTVTGAQNFVASPILTQPQGYHFSQGLFK